MIPPADVEDVVAEVYVIMIRRWDVGAVPDLAWLIATAKNLCRNHNRLGRIRLNQTLNVDESLPSQNFDDSGTDSIILRQDVRAAWRQLPPEYQEALVLFSLEDLSVEQCAQIAGVSTGNFKMRLHRASNQMREILANDHIDYER